MIARSKSKEQEQQATLKFRELTESPYLAKNSFKSPMTREDDRESRRFVGTMLCLCTSRDCRFDTREWSRCSWPGLGTLSCTDQSQLAEVLAEFCAKVISAFDSRNQC